MTFPTHLVAGLIIGRISGDYPTALAGSLLIDLDHLVSYYKHGILFKPRKLIKAVSSEKDPWGDQRFYLHSIFGFIVLSAIVLAINFKIGVVFFFAYLTHLILDALDSSEYYPLFPNKTLTLKGPIRYNSRTETLFGFALFLILALLFY
jgi:membrane-bound metal-dependent hydrolase YbcI (DUF457 family)